MILWLLLMGGLLWLIPALWLVLGLPLLLLGLWAGIACSGEALTSRLNHWLDRQWPQPEDR
jgi:hypothetical protein